MKNLLVPYAFDLLDKGYTLDYADGSIIFAHKLNDYVICGLEQSDFFRELLGPVYVSHELKLDYYDFLKEYA